MLKWCLNIPQFASPKIEVNFVKEIFVINVISFKHNFPDWNVNTASRGLRYQKTRATRLPCRRVPTVIAWLVYSIIYPQLLSHHRIKMFSLSHCHRINDQQVRCFKNCYLTTSGLSQLWLMWRRRHADIMWSASGCKRNISGRAN